MNNLMNTTRFGKAALHKFGSVPKGFHVFCAEWIGARPEDWKTMRVSGAQFKGKRRVVRTTMTTIVTREEMERFDAVRLT